MQFQNTTLSAEMLQAIATQNFTEMTEIQAKTIPLLLEGKDVIGKSNTGTGKTAAFSIPIIEQIPKCRTLCLRSDSLPDQRTCHAGLRGNRQVCKIQTVGKTRCRVWRC